MLGESFSSDNSFEPDIFDGLSLAPFVASQCLVVPFKNYIDRSLWNGLWIIPLSSTINLLTSHLLILASLINTLYSVMAFILQKNSLASHRISMAHATFLYGGVSFIRIFATTYNPLKLEVATFK